MIRVLVVSLCALFLFSADDKDGAKKDVDRLQGEWSMVSGEHDGNKLPEELVNTAKRVCKGEETTLTIGGQMFMKATFKIDNSKKPMTIDYTLLEGPNKGKKQLGIYEWDGDKVRFCFATPDNERPTDFTTKEGSNRILSVWKKAKKE